MANGNLPYPFPDAVSQFSVESTALGAQDGGHVGGMVNVVTRSGTNQYHGTGFEFIRNNYLDGQNFFSSCTPVHLRLPAQRRTRCTRTSSAERSAAPSSATRCLPSPDINARINRQAQASTQATVPTAANLAGDFSATDGVPGVAGSNPCNSSHAPITLVDPLTGTALAREQIRDSAHV